jgi:putative PIN family toxin of toxin-antitoxin system
MPKAVLDTTVFVRAFLRNVPGGVSHDLLRFAYQGTFGVFSCDGILQETARVLLRDSSKRKRYVYSDAEVVTYCQDMALLATIVGDLPFVKVVRDPNDDMIVACALAASADYIVTRDKDLLSLGTYQEIGIVTPEAFLHVLREHESKLAP